MVGVGDRSRGSRGGTQYPLESGKVGLPRSVHMQAHLLDGVGDVWPREGEVLEGASQAAVGRRVGNRRPVVLRELSLSVDRRGVGLAVRHASPLQDVDGVLALVEEETLRPALGGDAEEVVEGPQVLHRELPLMGEIVRCRRSAFEAVGTMSST
jgi:hypothetical protein